MYCGPGNKFGWSFNMFMVLEFIKNRDYENNKKEYQVILFGWLWFLWRIEIRNICKESKMENELSEGVSVIKLTDEQAAMDITIDRIDEYDRYVGEDFIDQNETIINMRMFVGFVMGRHPHRVKKLIDILNSEFGGFWSDIQEVFGDEVEENEENKYDKALEMFYQQICDFVNLTVSTKRRFNEILFSVKASYERKLKKMKSKIRYRGVGSNYNYTFNLFPTLNIGFFIDKATNHKYFIITFGFFCFLWMFIIKKNKES